VAALRGVADGVIEQVHEQAAEQVLIAAKGSVRRSEAGELDSAGGGGGLRGAAALASRSLK